MCYEYCCGSSSILLWAMNTVVEVVFSAGAEHAGVCTMNTVVAVVIFCGVL